MTMFANFEAFYKSCIVEDLACNMETRGNDVSSKSKCFSHFERCETKSNIGFALIFFLMTQMQWCFFYE